MRSDIIQAVAGTVQAAAGSIEAVSGVASAAASLTSLAITGLNEYQKLEISHSRMIAKMDKLEDIHCKLQDQLQTYWFPRKQCDRWSSAVKTTIDQVNALKGEFSNLKQTSGINIAARSTLTNSIDEKCKEIDEVIKEGKELDAAIKNRDIYRYIKWCTPVSIANVKSLKENLQQLLVYVKDETFNTVRVQGPTGTGKTVLIQHLNNREDDHHMFHIVIWIPASDFKNQDKRKNIEVEIQRCIADRLGICISGIKDEEHIANKIRAELDGAKYLLLLDDVKVNINLEKIGIPPNTQGSKIVYTTNFEVFPFGIPPHHYSFTLTMKKLSDGDSWQIFEDIVSKENVLLLRRDIKAIARQVVDCCDGLMSIIIIVAENFKLRDCLESWSNGLEMLKRPPMKEDIPMEALKKFLNFSYGSLTENEQICFLFCVLYPEDHKIPIDCLFDCWAANNLLQKGVPGKQILSRLLKMALLNECSNKQYVTVDNVCRKAAMKILREHGHLKCLVALEANTKLQKDDCKDIHWISLANSGIDGLPTEVDCPNLTTLFLQNNSKLKAISSSFFRNIGKLLVLDLYKTGLESVLPMSHMQMLKVLYVNSCAMLKEIPFKIEGADNRLEVVDIRGCVISEIPHDIKKLKHLRRLLVSIDCGRTLGDLNTTELSSLKELIVYVKSDVVHINVKSHKTWCYKVIEDILEKIDPSEELTALKFHFENYIVDIIEVLCDRLKIFVPKQGSLKHIWKERRNKHSTAQVYIGLEMTSSLQIPEFFPNTSFVLSCDKIVSDTVIDEVMGKVKALIMMRANSMENLHQNATSSSDIIHDCLIHKCDNIETFMQIDGFSNLKTLVLSECSQLKALFSNNVAQQVGIKHLEIRDCPTIEEINMLSTSCGDILPTLTTLILHNLRKLEKICSDMKWPSMSTLEIYKCPMLMTLPLNGNNANNLRNIKVEETWWETLQLDDEIKQKFEQYCDFSVQFV